MERNLSSFSDSKFDQVMTAEQFDQIVEAILSGKYSWACVLILRFAGYNPLHYIPYRTYNRLKKDNRINSQSKKVASKNERKSQASCKSSSRLRDLSYIEDLKDCSVKVNGGHGWGWLSTQF